MDFIRYLQTIYGLSVARMFAINIGIIIEENRCTHKLKKLNLVNIIQVVLKKLKNVKPKMSKRIEILL